MKEDAWDESDAVPIEGLTSETIEGVALRLRDSKTFTARTNREAELDALWTLADIASNGMRSAQWMGAAFPPLEALPRATADDFATLSELIFRAHDLNADDRADEAADVLIEAAQLTRNLAR